MPVRFVVALAVSLFDRKPDACARALVDYIRHTREEIFSVLAQQETKNPRRRKARCGFRVLLNNVKRILAERRGFEPRLGLTLNTLSRRAT
ncbi:MAG: hypothetical protein JWR14_2384 [Caballeronia sp.]|jgi:hypothetical protein|nr:hypothetical protein [Caballeronia sp.]